MSALKKDCRSSDGQDDDLAAGAPSLIAESAEGHIHQSPATDKVVGRLIDWRVAVKAGEIPKALKEASHEVCTS